MLKLLNKVWTRFCGLYDFQKPEYVFGNTRLSPVGQIKASAFLGIVSLFSVIVIVALMFLEKAIATMGSAYTWAFFVPIDVVIMMLVLCICILSLTGIYNVIRRLRDIGKGRNALWILPAMVFGTLTIIFPLNKLVAPLITLWPGNAKANRFGAAPGKQGSKIWIVFYLLLGIVMAFDSARYLGHL